jgi:succinyl-CoA synthetase alpha subunit
MLDMNLTPDSKVLIQGITEPMGAIYAAKMKAYGTNVVAAVSAGKGGQTIDDIPVYDLVEQVLAEIGAIDTSIILGAPYLALDAALEAIASGILNIILIPSGIPPLDMVQLLRTAAASETSILGPDTMGIIVPEKLLLGTHPSEFYTPGTVGLIGDNGTLLSEIALELTQAGFGQSICICTGSDRMADTSPNQWLHVLDKDKNTKVIVLVGQTSDTGEDTIAPYIAEKIDKPVIVYIAGRFAPLVKHQHHLSELMVSEPVALVDVETKKRKITVFEQRKIPVAQRPSQIPDLVKKALKHKS